MDEPKSLVAEHARALGLRVLDPYLLRDHHNVLVHLRPSPVLARLPGAQPIARDAGAHMRNEVSVVRFLAGCGAPVAPLSGELDPGPHDVGQTVVSYWAYIDHQAVEDPFRAGRALARCHTLLRGADLELEAPGGNPAHEALAIFEQLLDEGVVQRVRGRRLSRSVEHDLESVEALDVPKQVIHGDAHLDNVLMSARGLLWNDWEDAFIGPVHWDLSCLVATSVVTGAGRARTESALRGYGIDRLDPVVDVYVRLRAFQVACWLLLMFARDKSVVDRAEPWLAHAEPRRRGARRASAWLPDRARRAFRR